MKKSLLIIAIFMLLAGFSSKVFAQSSSPVTPAEGGTFNYVVGGLTANDTYVWGISTSENNYSTVAGDYTVTSTPALGSVGTVSGSSATLTVTWNAGASGDNYWVWIQIIDSEGCFTYRALPVNPIDAPAAYTVDFTVIALNATGDETTIPADITLGIYQVAVSDVCPSFVDEDWVSDGGIDDNSTTDGYTYVYFRVNRYSTTTSGWNITPTVSGASVWEVSVDASTWTTMNATQTVSTGDVLYVRATVANTTSSQVISFDIAATGQDAGGVYADANTAGVGSESNSASVTLDPLPTVGTFGGSY